MSYSDFLNLIGNAFTLFLDTITKWCNVLIHNYFFITILGVVLFCSLVLFLFDYFTGCLSIPSSFLKKSVDNPVTNNILYAEQNNNYLLQELSSVNSSTLLQYNNIRNLPKNNYKLVKNVSLNKSVIDHQNYIPDNYDSPGMLVPPPEVEEPIYYTDENYNSMEQGVLVPNGGTDFYNGVLHGDDYL